jgi:hypothetical protein
MTSASESREGAIAPPARAIALSTTCRGRLLAILENEKAARLNFSSVVAVVSARSLPKN